MDPLTQENSQMTEQDLQNIKKKKKTDFTKINPVQGGLNDLLLFIDTPSWFVKVVPTQTKATQIVS